MLGSFLHFIKTKMLVQGVGPPIPQVKFLHHSRPGLDVLFLGISFRLFLLFSLVLLCFLVLFCFVCFSVWIWLGLVQMFQAGTWILRNIFPFCLSLFIRQTHGHTLGTDYQLGDKTCFQPIDFVGKPSKMNNAQLFPLSCKHLSPPWFNADLLACDISE